MISGVRLRGGFPNVSLSAIPLMVSQGEEVLSKEPESEEMGEESQGF